MIWVNCKNIKSATTDILDFVFFNLDFLMKHSLLIPYPPFQIENKEIHSHMYQQSWKMNSTWDDIFLLSPLNQAEIEEMLSAGSCAGH